MGAHQSNVKQRFDRGNRPKMVGDKNEKGP